MTRHLILTVAIGLLPIAASAQPADDPSPDAVAAAQPSQGPMVVERIHNGFLVVPEAKFTEVDHKWSWLAGGYAGVVFADAFFIGGGGYGMVSDTHHGRELAYGGLVVQWFGRTSETFGYSAKMLIGGGTSETTDTVLVPVDRGRSINQAVVIHQDFLVFEPEVNGQVRFSKHLRLTGGVGYRFTGHGWYNHYYGYPGQHGPDGVVGTIGLQIGGGG